MARAYSDDLRRKVLQAYLGGKGTMLEMSERFDVSVAWVRKIAKAHRDTGLMSRPLQKRHGRQSRIDPAKVRALVKAKPDIVLREMQAAFAQAGHAVSCVHLWRVVRSLGLRLKKSRSTPPSATRKRTASVVKRSSRSSARSRRKT